MYANHGEKKKNDSERTCSLLFALLPWSSPFPWGWTDSAVVKAQALHAVNAGSSPASHRVPRLCLFVFNYGDFKLGGSYLESRRVRREASHVEPGARAQAPKEIVRVHLYPECTAV